MPQRQPDRQTRIRLPAALLAALTGLALPVAAQAQGKPDTPPASDATPPVELTIEMSDGHPVCRPAELRLPADSNVALNVVSRANQPVTVTIPGQLDNSHVLHADGDLVHVASEQGYTVKREGRGLLRLRTLPAGEKSFSCTGVNSRSNPSEGKLVLTPPSG